MFSEEDGKKMKKAQIATIIIAYLSYCSITASRTVWSYSKKLIIEDKEHWISKSLLGTVDLMWIIGYLLMMLISGRLGYRYNPKYVIAIGDGLVATFVILLAIFKYSSLVNVYSFCVVKFLNGVFQAFAISITMEA